MSADEIRTSIEGLNRLMRILRPDDPMEYVPDLGIWQMAEDPDEPSDDEILANAFYGK